MNQHVHEQALSGQGVLVTRPAHQAATLCRAIEAADGSALHCPTLAIAEPVEPQRVLQQLQALDAYDIAIFISANAVHMCLQLLGTLPEHLTLAAIGPASAEALAKHGYRVQWQPQRRHSSEGLLEVLNSEPLAGRRIAIIRGAGGREHLQQQLTAQRAQVTPIDVYRRVLPPDSAPILQRLLDAAAITLLTATSNQSIENLLLLAGEQYRASITALPLVVLSQRNREFAQLHGFTGPVAVAEQATEAAIIAALIELVS